MTRFRSLRRNRSFLGGVLKLVGGTTIAQAISVLSAPILSRLYTPDAFGTLSIFASLVGVFSVIACLRFDLAIVLPKEENEAASLFNVSLLAATFVAVLSALGLMVWGNQLIQLLEAPDLIPFLWMIPVTLFIQGFHLANISWNTRKKRFGRLSIARILASLTTSLLPIVLALIGKASSTSLVLSWIAGTIVFSGVLASQVWKDSWRLFLEYFKVKLLTHSVVRYRKFPLIDFWGSFINNLSWQLPPLIISPLFTPSAVGFYSLANRVLLLPMTLIGNAVSQVFFQRASETHARQSNLAESVEIVFRQLVALGLFPAILLTILGRELFITVFGITWAEAGVYAQILGPWLFFLFISSPISNLFVVLERQELALVMHLIILATRAISLWIGGVQKDIILALTLWTVSGVIVYGILAIWNTRLAGLSYKKIVDIFIRNGVYAIPTGLILVLIKASSNGVAWIVLSGSALAAIVYYFFLWQREKDFYRLMFSRMMPVLNSNPSLSQADEPDE